MEWVSNWAEAIIIAVIIATIIEMILPEGSSKKYIKVVIGIYILFTVISPVLTKLSGRSLAVSDIIDLDKYIEEVKEKEIEQNKLKENNSSSIRDIYIGNLKADIQNKLKGKGYVVTNIELDVGYDDNYTLYQIKLNVNKEEDEKEKENYNDTSTNIEVVNEVNISVLNVANETNKDINKEKKSNLSNSDRNKIKEYLSSVYEISEKNILIEGGSSNVQR